MIYTDGVHLVSADVERLHSFAQKIGLRRAWYQDHPRHPHYDLTKKRMAAKAIEHGAIRVSSKELIWLLRGGMGK